MSTRARDRRQRRKHRTVILLIIAVLTAATAQGQSSPILNDRGVQMSIDDGDRDPAIHIVIPGGPPAERSFNILMPEHLTVRKRGETDARHLYIYKPGLQRVVPAWKQVGKSLEYAEDLAGIHFSARATLRSDGILFHYEFVNHSEDDYDMVWAVTDPRFKTFFYDPRLERTYVHHSEGFDLLASETPARLTEPLSQWLPARYHAQLTAPIPGQRVQHRDDGITYFYKSRAIDVPLIATLSVDRQWVAASFSRNPGNVWSNPELTCQHVDPQVSLPKGSRAFYEIKILLFEGTLEDALKRSLQQRSMLKDSGAGR